MFSNYLSFLYFLFFSHFPNMIIIIFCTPFHLISVVLQGSPVILHLLPFFCYYWNNIHVFLLKWFMSTLFYGILVIVFLLLVSHVFCLFCLVRFCVQRLGFCWMFCVVTSRYLLSSLF